MVTMTIGVVWNPSKTERSDLEEALAGETDVRWYETSKDDPGQGPAAQALADGADLVIVAGGDGTVRAVAERLAETESTAQLGIVPLGTGNLLARNLDVPLNDIPAAIARALDPSTTTVDIGWVEVELEAGTERHGFVVMVGFGIDAHMIAETSDDLKSKAGWLAYVESLGRALSASEVLPFHVEADDEPARDTEGHTLLIANCGTLQAGIRLIPDADPSDGELDYLLLSADGLGDWLGTVKTMMWDNGLMRMFTKKDEVTNTDALRQGRTRRIAVTLPEPRAFEIDGEEIGDARGFVVTIQPGALRVR